MGRACAPHAARGVQDLFEGDAMTKTHETQQVRQTKWTLIAAAVAAALPLLGAATSAQAQYRSGQDGHANDAKMRRESGGYNTPVGRGTGVTPNQIFYGNVTGLDYFHGNLGSTDPL